MVDDVIVVDPLIPGLQTWLTQLPVPLDIHMLDDAETFAQWPMQRRERTRGLFIRSTTRVNQALLALFPNLQFLASATSGVDHLDTDALEAAGVHWIDAKGCNAQAVADYCVLSLAALVKQGHEFRDGRTVVVGYGCVGKSVMAQLEYLGCQPYWIDPFLMAEPRTLSINDHGTAEGWLSETTLLCVHTPLRLQSPWSTVRWLNESRLNALPEGAVVVVAGRGESIDGDAMVRHAHRLHFVMDVWPDEPEVAPALIHAAALATPHIAGHSRLGKLKGAVHVFQRYCQWRGLPCRDQQWIEEVLAVEGGEVFVVPPIGTGHVSLNLQLSLMKIAPQLSINLITQLDTAMKMIGRDAKAAFVKSEFKKLRAGYQQHPEIRWVKAKKIG